MAKLEQALQLDPPNELHFKGPFNEVTTSHLKLTNPTERQIAFKVKTTAPKTYCVRPNGGIIQPKQSITVAVMLQPFSENDDRSKDKFMVQSMYVPEGDVNHDTMWHDTPPEGLMNSKLKCIFDSLTDAATAAAPLIVAADVVDKTKPEVKSVVVPEIKTTKEAESEAKRMREEYRKLKVELQDLRQENSSLKEEGLRQRVAQDTRTRGTSAKPYDTDSHHSTSSGNKLGLSNYLFIISFFIFLLGIYIGKYVL
ncbi:vesicle-associated membrane protein-associated protein B/C [Parasteatoda tepidariorum]|uniref:vesicle-associated membrane protein-associated protein B/C n=1 Tax=Parasteatoda tepidariorum TaxID=114398 RepID=UPI00077F9866|nr:vesicle-associated membrane protein-associated protein B/C [Parasteatoda tepidariorum]